MKTPRVNPHSAGGAVNIPPFQYFSLAQKRQQISTRNFKYLIRHQFDVSYQTFRKIRREFLRKWRFSDVMGHYFGSKSSKCLKASRMYRCEVKRNPKTPKGVILSHLENGCLRFLKFSILTPQIKIFFFQKKASIIKIF